MCLTQLTDVLQRAQAEACKDDKLTEMMKAAFQNYI